MNRASPNHVFRLVWNERLNTWIPVPETARARGKRASRAFATPLMLALGLGSAAYAMDAATLPTQGQIVAGQGTITQQGNTLTLNQSSQQLIANWDTFNIGQDASVVFQQPGASSVALNRVLDANPSQIFGSLSAKGQVYLVNPSGVVFGQTAQVNVGGLVASSLDIRDEDFLAGNLQFAGSDTSGAVINRGAISASSGGTIALLAPQVFNEGSINAHAGSALLAAGRGVSLDFVGDGLISYHIDEGTAQALVQNGGLVQADGGLAVLSARGVDAVSQAVVNNTGTVRARTLASREGRILLLSDMEHGTTYNEGTLDASAPDSGNGGFIDTSAATVKIGAGSLIDTRAARGEVGEWLLDPSDITIAASGGTMTGATLAAQLNSTNVTLDTSAGNGGNGDIFINDTVTSTGSYVTGGAGSGRTLTLRANRDIQINGTINGSPYPLNLVLRASRDVHVAGTGQVNTNGGNFVVGIAPTVIGNMATPSGTNFSVADGGRVQVGSGSLDINVVDNIHLAAGSLSATGSTYRYLNSGYTDYVQSSYLRLKGGSITTANAGSSADINGMSFVTLDAAQIGATGAPVKIGRISLGHSLTVNNTLGSSYVNVVNANPAHGFSSVNVNIDQQASSRQQLLLGGDLNSHGHIRMDTDGSGTLLLADDDIDTSGVRSNISISARNMEFANNSVDVGSAAFSAAATTLRGSGNDGIVDVTGGTLGFSGTGIGSLTRPLEIAGGGATGAGNMLSVNNSGGSSYLRSLDDSFTSVYMNHVKTAGHHSVRFLTDHIDYTTDGTGILMPTLGVGSGADVQDGNRFISFTANTGDIRFDTDSVNTGSGTLQAVISSGNPDGASGAVIHAVNAKDGAAEITTGNAQFTVYRSGTGSIQGIEVAKGTGMSNGALTVSTYAGNVDLTELDPEHFKSISLTLHGTQANGQAVNIALTGGDNIALTDSSTRLLLDAGRLDLDGTQRSWQLSAGSRNVQIDSNTLGSGNYNVYANNLYLNGDVLTNGGHVTLGAASNNLYVMRPVRIDSNADDVANATSTGAAGNISMTGNVSSSNGNGNTLNVDASSSTNAGGTLYFNGNLGNNGGSYLGGASFTTQGATTPLDGSLTFTGSSYLLNGTFSAFGYTNFNGTFLDVLVDTEQGNTASAGDVLFGGRGLVGSQYSGYTFNASTLAAGGNGGRVDLAATSGSTLYAKAVTVVTTGGNNGTNGNISLPAVSTAGTYYNGTTTSQTYTGNVISLHGNLSTNGGHVTVTGDARLAESVAIRTSISNPATAAGNVSFAGTGVSATAADRNLTINTSTTTASGYNAGSVTLRTGNAGGASINNLSIESRALGAGGNSADVSLATGITTSGNQTYAARNVLMNGNLSTPGQVALTIASASSLSPASSITAGSLLLQGGAFTLTHAGNQIGTLAAQSGALTLANSGPLTIGTVGGTVGVTSSGAVNISTATGDLTLARSVSSTNTGTAAVTLNAGVSATAGIATGGNIIVSNGATISTGNGGRATLYSGSVDNSTGLSALAGTGSGRFRYNSDETSTGYTSALGTGLHAIYREQPVVTVMANDATAEYGTTASLTAALAGGKNGDIVSGVSLTVGDADPTTADGAISTSGHLIAGEHSIQATGTAGVAALGYSVSGTSGGVLTITPKALLVSAITANRAYDGTTTATLDEGSGVVNGRIVGDLVNPDYSQVTASFADKAAGTGKALSISGISLGGADAANYTVSGTGTGTITPRVLNVGFDGVSRTYDGTTGATVTATDDRVAHDVLSIGQLASFESKDAGTGKRIDVSQVTLGGADAGNYTLASATGTTTADITPRTLQVAFTGVDRIYDGSVDATVLSSDDRLTDDIVSVEASATFRDRHAGIGKQIDVDQVVLTGADAGNYVLASTTGVAAADITPRLLNVSFTGVDRAFDGTTRASVTSSDDRVAGDVLAIGAEARFTDRDMGTDKPIVVTGVTLGGPDAGNYQLASASGSAIAAITVNPGLGTLAVVGASNTSAQAGQNASSGDTMGSASRNAVGRYVARSTGSPTLAEAARPLVGDDRIASFEGTFNLAGPGGTSAMTLSRSADNTTLNIAGAPAKATERSALPLYSARGADVRGLGALNVVDAGNSLSVAAVAGDAASIDVAQTTGPVATGRIERSGSAPVSFQLGVTADSILVLSLPADAPAVDEEELALLGLALAAQELRVTAGQLKGLVIRRG